MKPQIITTEKGDTCIKELQILCSQPDGMYEYVPKGGDIVQLNIKNSDNVIVYSNDVTVEEGNTDRVVIEFPADLDEGTYTYDVIIKTEDEKHTICNEYILEMKEDDAYEKLV